jgi:hypothetical protein
MDQSLVPLISGLIGALIGAAASVATIVVQSHYQTKREFRRMAFDAAIEDHKLACDIAKANQQPAEVAPLTAFLHFHYRYLELLEKGELNASTLQQLKSERDQLFGASQ